MAKKKPRPPKAPAPISADQKWPADKVERWAIDRLVPYARNARTHSAAQIDQIAASIREWGWTTPVLVDETGMIIAGHGRVLAAQKLGLPEIPVMQAVGWSEAQKRAYVLADNQLALTAGWDEELLKVELADIDAMDFDLARIGFDDKALKALLDPPGEDEPDTSEQLDGLKYQVVVACRDEDHQRELLEKFEAEFWSVKR